MVSFSTICEIQKERVRPHLDQCQVDEWKFRNSTYHFLSLLDSLLINILYFFEILQYSFHKYTPVYVCMFSWLEWFVTAFWYLKSTNFVSGNELGFRDRHIWFHSLYSFNCFLITLQLHTRLNSLFSLFLLSFPLEEEKWKQN